MPLVALAGLVAGVTWLPAPAARAADPDVQRTVGGPGALGAVTVIGDSVLYGSKDSLPESLVAAGFGPVRYRAGSGYTTGNRVPANQSTNAANWISSWRAEGWDAPTVIVNLGDNDVGRCDDTDDCERAVRYMMERIGTRSRVLWPKISHFYPADAAMWNAALERVAGDSPNLVLWDWPAALAAAGIPMWWDNIHLRDPAAYAERSVLLTQALVEAVSGAKPSGQAPHVAAASGAPSAYVPLTPQRVLDTRATGGRVAAGATVTVDLTAHVPAGATAAAVNLTAVEADAAGHLTAWPCASRRPDVSSVNFAPGGARGAHAVVPLTDRRLCVFSPVPLDVIVDLQGAFVPAAKGGHGLRYQALTRPSRLVDTRGGQRVVLLTVLAPPGAAAVTVNVTATAPLATGYVSAYPCGVAQPNVSNVNFAAGETVAGAAYVPVSTAGTFCVAAVGHPHVTVDLTGVFGPTGTLTFTPAAPTRVLDTRDGAGGWIGRLGPGQHIRTPVAPPGAAAVTGTVTALDAAADAFASAGASLPPVPGTSNVNVARGGTIANSVTTAVAADGSLELYASAPEHVLFDVTGWWSSP